jgi:hypothetical protein
MKRLLFVLAACGHSHPATSVDAAAPAGDAAELADAAAPDAAAPDAPPGFVIPPADLGMQQVPGACTTTYRGWAFNDATGCTPNDYTEPSQPTRQITIAQMGALYDVTTGIFFDGTSPYTVELGTSQPTATKINNVTCNPIYGTCITHTWTLTAHALTLATTYLHDNSSPSPIPQCWEYYYQRTDCTFALSW